MKEVKHHHCCSEGKKILISSLRFIKIQKGKKKKKRKEGERKKGKENLQLK